MKQLAMMLTVGLFMAGCSGGKYYQSWPMESQIDGTAYHYHNAVQLNLPATRMAVMNEISSKQRGRTMSWRKVGVWVMK